MVFRCASVILKHESSSSIPSHGTESFIYSRFALLRDQPGNARTSGQITSDLLTKPTIENSQAGHWGRHLATTSVEEYNKWNRRDSLTPAGILPSNLILTFIKALMCWRKNFVFHFLHDTITARLCVNNANLGELVHH